MAQAGGCHVTTVMNNGAASKQAQHKEPGSETCNQTATTIIRAHKQQHFQQATCSPNPCRVLLPPPPPPCCVGLALMQRNCNRRVLHKKGCVRHAAQHGCVQHRIGGSKANKRGTVQGAGTIVAPPAHEADIVQPAWLCHRQPAKHCGAAARLCHRQPAKHSGRG